MLSLARFMYPETFAETNPFVVYNARRCGALVIAIASAWLFSILA